MGFPPPAARYLCRVLQRVRPYGLQIFLLTYTPVLLWADAHFARLEVQEGLGVLTFGVLAVATRWALPAERRQVWLCVGVATCFEALGSIVWGVYRYRLGNLPLFVPPGHGLVYLFGLTATRTPLLRDHGRGFGTAVLAAAAAWAIGGLTLLPALTGRYDLLGAGCLPIFAWFLLRSPRHRLFAAIFVAVAELEIFGTGLGNWQWLAVVPHTGVTDGNPPSVIAGGYCVIDGSVMAVLVGLSWIRERLSRTALPLSPVRERS